MNRRDLIKNVLLVAGALASDFAWSKDLRSPSSQKHVSISPDEQGLLAEIMETFIPETTTPGAKSLKLDQFASRMIRDCYVKTDQGLFNKGLAIVDQTAVNTFKKNFIQSTRSERESVLKKMQDSDDQVQKDFVKIIKALTIAGYQNSEYVMTNVHHYNMNPGFYNGCVPVSKS